MTGDYACCAAEFFRARQPPPWFRSPMLSFQMENVAFVSWEAIRNPTFLGRTWFFSFADTKKINIYSEIFSLRSILKFPPFPKNVFYRFFIFTPGSNQGSYISSFSKKLNIHRTTTEWPSNSIPRYTPRIETDSK